MLTEKTSSPVRLSAYEILKRMAHPKASPSNVLRLVDPGLYVQVEPEKVLAETSKFDLTDKQKEEFEKLGDEMRYFKEAINFKKDRLSTYFILRVQQIMQKGGSYDTD